MPGAQERRPRAAVLIAFAALLLAAPAVFTGGAAARTSEAPRNSGPPTISGVVDVGQTLTGHNGSWLYNDGSACGSECTYSFQWQRCDAAGSVCTDIAGAANQSYVVAPADAGSKLRVAVTATKYDCNALNQDCRWVNITAYSAQTALVPGVAPAPPAPPAADGLPAITGTPQEAQTLTAVLGLWRGSSPLSFAVQWYRCVDPQAGSGQCTTIEGATGQSYTVAVADIGTTLRVIVTASNTYGNASATSPPTVVVEAMPNIPPEPMIAPTVFGTAREGQTLTAAEGAWTGTPGITFSFQWERCTRLGSGCAAIIGETTERHLVSAADGGRTLRVVVTATNRAGSATAESPLTTPVEPKGLVYLDTGEESVPVASVSPPDRLRIGGGSVRVLRGGVLRFAFRVSDTRGYVVRGARVTLSGARAGEVSSAGPRPSRENGSVTLSVRVSAAKLRKGGKLVLVVEAAKPGYAGSAVSARARVTLRLARGR